MINTEFVGSYGLLVNETIASYSTTRLVSILIVDVLQADLRYLEQSVKNIQR